MGKKYGVRAKYRIFDGKKYMWEDEAFHAKDAEKKKASLQKRGWLVRVVKTPSKWNPNRRTIYIRKRR